VLVGAGAAAVAGLGAAALLRRAPPPGRALGLTPVALAALEDAGSPGSGAARPKVRVAVFTDYLCPICRATDHALRTVLDRNDDVRVIYKLWPIFGPASARAARTALAAGYQGRFDAMHDALMAAGGRLDLPGLQAAAVAAGANPMVLDADLAAHAGEIDRQLEAHAAQAWALGLQGTPAYLVEDVLYQGGLGAAALGAAVDRARRKA